MKVATYRIGDERRVGVVDERKQTVAAFDIPRSEAELGVLALLGRTSLPTTLSPMPLSEARLEAPIPRPRRNIFCVGKNYHEHAKEFASSGFDFERGGRRRAEASDHLLQSTGMRDRTRPAGSHRPGRRSQAVDYEAELARHHRHWRPRHSSRERARSRLGLHDRQRRDRARSSGPLQPVADRQVAGHVLPDGALGRHARRDRSLQYVDQVLDQRRIAAERQHPRSHLRRARRSSRRFPRASRFSRATSSRPERRPASASASSRRNISCPATSRASRSTASAFSKIPSSRRGHDSRGGRPDSDRSRRPR